MLHNLEKSPTFLKLLGYVKTMWEIFSNFYGLFKISDLYKTIRQNYRKISTSGFLTFSKAKLLYKIKRNMNIFSFSMEMKLIGKKGYTVRALKAWILHTVLFRADVRLSLESLSKMHFSIGVDQAQAWSGFDGLAWACLGLKGFTRVLPGLL